jgi:hypothetical protein
MLEALNNFKYGVLQMFLYFLQSTMLTPERNVKDIGQDGLLATDHFAVLSSSSSNLI